MAANTHVYIQKSGTDNKKKGTYSLWLKRSLISSQQYVIGNLNDANNYGYIRFKADDILQVLSFYSSATNASLKTNRKFRDTNAWYHIVVRIDMAQAATNDRMRLYVNGVEETSYSAQSASSDVNNGLLINSASTGHRIASQDTVSGERFDGLISHVHYCDGYSYGPEEFGETDSTTGQWKIKVDPSVTYGSTGYFMFKDNASLNDQSGNSNNFTAGAGGAPTPTVDSPSNVFATFNALDNYLGGGTLANGNTKYTSVSSKHDFAVSTLGMESGSGKFYAEFKVHQDTDYNIIGISDHSYQGSNQELSEDNYSYGYYNDTSDGKVRANSSNVLTGMPDFGNGDIIGVAVDLENHKLYFSKNGTFINSGDPTSGATGTGAVSIQDLSSVSTNYGQGVYFFAAGLWNTSASGSYSANFGNGYFGTTAITSEGTNASGIGKFEYDVPTGYTALSTKGLNE